ncbi:MAG: XdhC family protein [Chloroflexi bacterium]|nr:XdhC family protein [Chloroflexota bacterium]
MKDLVSELSAWETERAPGAPPTARAVVVRTFGSAPRPEGAVMLVSGDGRLAGSVSGGCVEGAAYEAVEHARATGHSRVIRFGITDEQAWDVGLACGGTIDVLVEPVVSDAVRVAARELGTAVITPLPADAPGPTSDTHTPGEGALPATPLVLDAAGALAGTTGDATADAQLAAAAVDALQRGHALTVELLDRSWFIETFPRRPRLVIVGAVQVAISLVAIAHTLGYETVVIDGRTTFATRERFPDTDQLLVGWPDELADTIDLGPRDAVAVLTHDVKFDEPAIITALARGCRYVGAVGCRKTQASRRERLLAAGVDPRDLARLRGPIGLDLGGREPAETALSIMSEVLAARYGGSGVPMRDRAQSSRR